MHRSARIEQVIYVARDGQASRRAVTVRDLDDERVEVLVGLEEGERVLSGAEIHRVGEGVPILIELADVAL